MDRIVIFPTRALAESLLAASASLGGIAVGTPAPVDPSAPDGACFNAAPWNDASCAVWASFGAAFGVQVREGAVDGPLWTMPEPQEEQA